MSQTELYGLTSKQIETINTAFKKYPQIKQVFIFGSRATGDFKKGSDIDFVIKNSAIDLELLLDLKAELNERIPLPFKFDVVDYSSVQDAAFKSHIDDTAQDFYCAA